MGNQKEDLLNAARKLLKFWIIIGIALFVIGIICLCAKNSHIPCEVVDVFEYDKYLEKDYRDCTNDDGRPCSDFIENVNKPCICDVEINVAEITAKPDEDIVILYRLDNFNESAAAKRPNFLNSWDDKQLEGILTDPPSKACAPYDYVNNVTIVPCGALADAMFNDTIYLKTTGAEIVPNNITGLLTESQKKGYHNPPFAQNLSFAFQNFSRPMNWMYNIWELDPMMPENNGFENEWFVAWMNTGLVEKPHWRLSKTGVYANGLPKGDYELVIDYKYPRSLYDGPRTVILARRRVVRTQICTITYTSMVLYNIGVTTLVLGIIFLLLAAALHIIPKYNAGLPIFSRTPVPSNAENKEQFNNQQPTAMATEQNLIHDKDKRLNNVEEVEIAPTSPAVLKDVEPEQKLIKHDELRNVQEQE